MYNLLIWHQEVEVVKFLGEIHSTEEDFLQLPNEKLSASKQFPCHNLIVNRHQITSSRNKHSALITDTETYINLKRHKIHELFDASISSTDMNQLVVWIDSVQNLLNTSDTTDNQEFNGDLPRFYLQMNLVNSLQTIQFYYSYLDKKLMEISHCNTTVESVYCLLSEKDTVNNKNSSNNNNSIKSVDSIHQYICGNLLCADYLAVGVLVDSHKMNRNKERERLSTVDRHTIAVDVLTEQKSLTVDKEIVINSTSRQMDHLGIDSFNHNHLLVADVMTTKCYNTQVCCYRNYNVQ
ncbi:Spectrin beta chain [Schistosoma japonicum]|nr:Spectrin beta chain [Schistosoma japonicum]